MHQFFNVELRATFLPLSLLLSTYLYTYTQLPHR